MRPPPLEGFGNIKLRAMADHMRRRCLEGDVVSLPASLISCLRPLCNSANAIQPEDVNDEGQGESSIFIKLTLHSPSHFRSVPMTTALGCKMSDRSALVTLHRAACNHDGRRSIIQTPLGSSMVFDFDYLASHLELMESDMLKCSRCDHSSCVLLGLDLPDLDQHSLENVVRELVLHRASPGARTFWRQLRTSSAQPILRALERAGLVSAQPSGQPGCDDWSWTRSGASRLKYVRVLDDPKRLFESRFGLHDALEDATNWELMQILQSEDWVWQPMPATKFRAALQHTIEGDKIWYSTPSQVCTPYLLCLLSMPLLKDFFHRYDTSTQRTSYNHNNNNKG